MVEPVVTRADDIIGTRAVAVAIRLPNNEAAQLAEDVTRALASACRHPVAEALLGGWRTCGAIAVIGQRPVDSLGRRQSLVGCP